MTDTLLIDRPSRLYGPVRRALAEAGVEGATSLELSQRLGHDTPGASGSPVARSLSEMHEAGEVVRLAVYKNRYSTYVLPEFVNGRTTIPRGQHHCDGCTCEGRDR
jgi:hypothetical protein